MKRVNRFIASVLFYVFVVVILLWTASLTYEMVKLLKPGDEITPWFALMLFDGGALSWLYVWREKARGAGQRGIALMMMVADLIGVAIMSGGDLVMGGQTYMAVGDLGKYLLLSLIIWTLINVAAIYAYHVNEPEVIEEAENQDALDEIVEKAREKNRKNIERIVDTVADARAYELTMRALAATFPVGTPREVLQAYADPVKHQMPASIPVPPPYTERESNPVPKEERNPIKRFFGGRGKTQVVRQQSGYTPDEVDGINSGEGIPVELPKQRKSHKAYAMARHTQYQASVPVVKEVKGNPTNQRQGNQ